VQIGEQTPNAPKSINIERAAMKEETGEAHEDADKDVDDEHGEEGRVVVLEVGGVLGKLGHDIAHRETGLNARKGTRSKLILSHHCLS
jgi:hypothetical protein